MPARPWRARATPARTAAGDPRAPAATGHAAATRTTLEPGQAKENGLAGGSARRCSQAGRTVPANRAPRRGEKAVTSHRIATAAVPYSIGQPTRAAVLTGSANMRVG